MATATADRVTDQRLADTPPPAGYWIDWQAGAWRSLPWPDSPHELPASLGFGVIRWAETWLVHHLTGEPWRFTLSQKRFLVLHYAVDATGEWLYRRSVLRRSKGCGKDPLGAVMLLVEMFGPVIFARLDERGDPVGKAHRSPLCQIAANSEAQGQDLLFVANAMVSKALKSAVGYEAGKLKSASKSGARLEILTSSVRTAEGDPATFVVMNENHHFTASNGGKRMADVVRRNVAKSPQGQARVVELTNAFSPGDGSTAEDTYEAWQAQVAGRTTRADILYDSCEAPAYLSLHTEADVTLGLRAAYADAPWVDLGRIAAEVDDLTTSVADAIRFYFNQLAVNESHWVDPRAFDACAATDTVLADGDEVALFLDCSKSEDATVLGGCRIGDGYSFQLGGWQRPHGDRGTGWLAPREQVDAAVRQAFDRYTVRWFGVDPSPARDDETEAAYWKPLIDSWHQDFRAHLTWASPHHAVEFDLRTSVRGGRERNRVFTEQAMLTVDEIEGVRNDAGIVVTAPTLTHDGDPMLRAHVHNAHRRSNAWGFSLGKVNRDSKAKVDAAVVMVGARLGRTLVRRNEKPKPRRRVVARRW